LKTTITKFSYQFVGAFLFSDVFDGTFVSNWNQLSGTWLFRGSVNNSVPNLFLQATSNSEDKIMLVGSNGTSYGAYYRVFFRNNGVGHYYFYPVYIDANNWLRLDITQASSQWAAVKSIAGATTTIDSGTLPWSFGGAGGAYGIFIRRYEYFKFQFIIHNSAASGGSNGLAVYSPLSESFVAKNSGSGEYDLSATFQANASWQVPFTVGIGTTSFQGGNPTELFYFIHNTYDDPNNLGNVMTRLARLAGIFSFKPTYNWRELLFIPSFTGNYEIRNRQVSVDPSGTAISGSDSFGNGEITFTAKCMIPNDTATAGFRFVFRADAATPTACYYFHVMKDNSGSSPHAVFARFERLYSGTTYQFYNSGYDATDNPIALGSLNIDLTQWNTYRIVMIDGLMYAYINDVMVAAFNDNNHDVAYLTSGYWGFAADANTRVNAQEIKAPNFWKPVQTFSFNPGDDAESAIETLITSLRAWFFSDLWGRFKAIFLNSGDASTYTYDNQLYQSNTDDSDKEYVAQVTVYGNGVMATARNTNLMPGVQTRDMVIVDYSISTLTDAQTRANNELLNANQFVNQYKPKQALNVGAELFDAVTVVNTGNNTSGVDSTTRVYDQTITQGGGNNTSDYSIELDTGNLS
jgi:hypothetical protein